MEESDYDYAEGTLSEAEERLAEIMADNVYHQTTITQLKSKVEKLELECKRYAQAIEEWQSWHNEQTAIVDAQAAEIHKLKEDYNREMASVDQLIEESDKKLKEAYETIDGQNEFITRQDEAVKDLSRQLLKLQHRKNLDDHVQF